MFYLNQNCNIRSLCENEFYENIANRYTFECLTLSSMVMLLQILLIHIYNLFYFVLELHSLKCIYLALK